MANYQPLALGPLPVQAINATLGTELEPGEVYMSERAREHIALKHPDDYEVVISTLPIAVADPTFVG